jgi:hypothetical protein
MTFTFGIKNLTDAHPPLLFYVNGGYQGHRTLAVNPVLRFFYGRSRRSSKSFGAAEKLVNARLTFGFFLHSSYNLLNARQASSLRLKKMPYWAHACILWKFRKDGIFDFLFLENNQE